MANACCRCLTKGDANAISGKCLREHEGGPRGTQRPQTPFARSCLQRRACFALARWLTPRLPPMTTSEGMVGGPVLPLPLPEPRPPRRGARSTAHKQSAPGFSRPVLGSRRPSTVHAGPDFARLRISEAWDGRSEAALGDDGVLLAGARHSAFVQRRAGSWSRRRAARPRTKAVLRCGGDALLPIGCKAVIRAGG